MGLGNLTISGPVTAGRLEVFSVLAHVRLVPREEVGLSTNDSKDDFH